MLFISQNRYLLNKKLEKNLKKTSFISLFRIKVSLITENAGYFFCSHGALSPERAVVRFRIAAVL